MRKEYSRVEQLACSYETYARRVYSRVEQLACSYEYARCKGGASFR